MNAHFSLQTLAFSLSATPSVELHALLPSVLDTTLRAALVSMRATILWRGWEPHAFKGELL